MSEIYPMFIEPTITWIPSGFSGYIWLDTKIVLKKQTWGLKNEEGVKNLSHPNPDKSSTENGQHFILRNYIYIFT